MEWGGSFISPATACRRCTARRSCPHANDASILRYLPDSQMTPTPSEACETETKALVSPSAEFARHVRTGVEKQCRNRVRNCGADLDHRTARCCVYFTGVMKGFKGHVVRLLRHPCGSRVINELYTAASTKQRRGLTAEFYGREAVLFHEARGPSCQPQNHTNSLRLTDACGMRLEARRASRESCSSGSYGVLPFM